MPPARRRTTPSELTANSSAVLLRVEAVACCWNRNDEHDRYENSPLKVMPPMISTPMKTRSLKHALVALQTVVLPALVAAGLRQRLGTRKIVARRA